MGRPVNSHSTRQLQDGPAYNTSLQTNSNPYPNKPLNNNNQQHQVKSSGCYTILNMIIWYLYENMSSSFIPIIRLSSFTRA